MREGGRVARRRQWKREYQCNAEWPRVLLSGHKMESFDTETFIMAIQDRPIIWDSRLPEYSNKIAKRKAWEEINIMFDSEFGEKSNKEKNACATELQRKWKSLKDSYNRERLKEKNCRSGSGAKPRKQYVYYKLLTFLQPLSEIRPPSQSTDTEEYDTEGCFESFAIPKSKKVKSSSDSIDDAQNKLYEVLTDKLKKVTPSIEHPDQHFLLSLFPHFNSIKDEYKLDAKADIINLLRKYNSMPQTSSYSQYGYQSGYQNYNTAPTGRSDENNASQVLNSYHTPRTPAGANGNTTGSSSEQNFNEYNFSNDDSSQDSEIITNLYSP